MNDNNPLIEAEISDAEFLREFVRQVNQTSLMPFPGVKEPVLYITQELVEQIKPRFLLIAQKLEEAP